MKQFLFNHLYLLKSKLAWKIIVPLFLLLGITGFFSPDLFAILTFKSDAAGRLTSNLLTGFIAMPSLVLTIAAILFAILQVSNRKITIIEVVFENSYLIPVIYWALINILAICILQIIGDSIDSYLLRALVCLSYNFALLLIGLFIVLYRCFRYLSYANITDDYLLEVRQLLKKEKTSPHRFDGQSLRQKGKEVYAELVEAIRKDDVILARKYLDSFAHTLNFNPSSNYIADFNNNLSKWILLAYKSSGEMFSALIEFWRSHLISAISGEIKFTFNNVNKVPLLTYRLIENDKILRTTITGTFSLRLKEISQRFLYQSWEKAGEREEKEVIRQGTNFDKLIKVHLEFNELVKYLVTKADIKTLAIVVNDIVMMRDAFINGEYRNIRTQKRVYRGRQQEHQLHDPVVQARYETARVVVIDAEAILLGNLFWLYFEVFNQRLDTNNYPHALEVIRILEEKIRYDDVLEIIAKFYFQDIVRYGWEDWIWNAEERLNGRVYTLATTSDLMAVGFAITLMRHPDFTPARYMISNTEELRFLSNRSREYLNRIRTNLGPWEILFHKNSDELSSLVDQALQKIGQIDEQVEDDFIQRLAQSPVSETRVNEFIEMLYQQWDETRNLSRIFEYFKAIEVNPEIKLQDAGPNNKLSRGKVLVATDDLYQHIYGIEWGKQVNRGVEARFAQKINELAEDKVVESLASLLEESIQAIKQGGYDVNVIMVDSDVFYRQELELAGSGRYSALNDHINPYPFEISGFFDNNIPVFVLSSIEYDNLILVASLPSGIVMQQRQNERYHGKNLIIEINVLTDQDAQKIITEQTEKGQEPKSLVELTTDIHVHVHQIFDFKVIDQKALKVYRRKIV